jgi:1-deoxy-D-xylulose-5-phosphate reductoisomerase
MEEHTTASARDIVLLGSTGSIGVQAVDVIARNRDRFRVVGLAAGGGRLDLLAQQTLLLRPEIVTVAEPQAAKNFRPALRAEAVRQGLSSGQYAIPKIVAGPDAIAQIAAWPCDVVLNGLAGSLGLAPTLAALDAGRTLALANKESLIVGGPLVRQRALPGQIVPVDSEHSALAQALRGGRAEEVRQLVLTASGGPFRTRRRADLVNVRPADALAHPTWSMGPLVTINSATLVNKGLEVIEANLLFDIPLQDIAVTVHPQSVVHSMVDFYDGSTLVQASPPDMRLPISLALGWPDRVPDAIPGIDWRDTHTWEFFPLDNEAFPAVQLAREAGEAGGTAPAVFNAANEQCVEAFLQGRLPFLGIVDTIGQVVAENRGPRDSAFGIQDVLDADAWARRRAVELISRGPRMIAAV